ncbi:unnamed protein product (macronuclear) [Paramecium tetraurelia]|uniref:Transmembrane protein n=1 Tax=Paramecium tetraurelia TaxID=5888 RepID=A0E8C2_PARTE|nr:uncharacterized protein GSPATT00024267001 [Paramecium tetraurelia]CAK91539.1 unnamed protein product [Paramecium tetraurelia]|eukprot:XP_001458936.1 hypothetical protein (macronuclear) [Paramecium tetraurelia strain d4-2]
MIQYLNKCLNETKVQAPAQMPGISTLKNQTFTRYTSPVPLQEDVIIQIKLVEKFSQLKCYILAESKQHFLDLKCYNIKQIQFLRICITPQINITIYLFIILVLLKHQYNFQIFYIKQSKNA